jgi:hypothetical protein
LEEKKPTNDEHERAKRHAALRNPLLGSGLKMLVEKSTMSAYAGIMIVLVHGTFARKAAWVRPIVESLATARMPSLQQRN